tara:strand:- start:129 stop:260 length:132 start_codon:yes stop_codon:yes gene_type:complete
VNGQRHPIPRQQFIQPIDLVIVDTVEDSDHRNRKTSYGVLQKN